MDAPEEAVEIITRMCRQNREQRYQDMTAVLDDLSILADCGQRQRAPRGDPTCSSRARTDGRRARTAGPEHVRSASGLLQNDRDAELNCVSRRVPIDP